MEIAGRFIPREIVCLIVGYLPMDDMPAIAGISKVWRSAAGSVIADCVAKSKVHYAGTRWHSISPAHPMLFHIAIISLHNARPAQMHAPTNDKVPFPFVIGYVRALLRPGMFQPQQYIDVHLGAVPESPTAKQRQKAYYDIRALPLHISGIISVRLHRPAQALALIVELWKSIRAAKSPYATTRLLRCALYGKKLFICYTNAVSVEKFRDFAERRKLDKTSALPRIFIWHALAIIQEVGPDEDMVDMLFDAVIETQIEFGQGCHRAEVEKIIRLAMMLSRRLPTPAAVDELLLG